MAGRPVARPLPLASPLGSLEPPRAARRALRRHRNRARPLSTAACHACWRATEPPSEPKRPPLAARTRKSTCALPARNSNWSPLALSALTTGPGWPRARRLWAGTGAPPQAAFASSLGPGGQPRRGREPLERWGPRARACGAACAGMWGRGHVGARACGGFLRLRGRLGARGTLRVLRCPRASGARWSRAGRGPCMPCAGRVPWPPDPWMPRRVQTATAPEWSKEEESAAWGGQAQRPLPCLGGVGRRALFAGPGSGPGGSPCASGRASGADGCRTRRREPRALRACGAASRPDAARESTQRSSPLLHATAPPP